MTTLPHIWFAEITGQGSAALFYYSCLAVADEHGLPIA
jgi:hypothetical protein